MTRPRFLLFGLSILLLILVGTGFYVYQHLPDLLRQQALNLLDEYGVEDVSYTGLALSNDEVGFATLEVNGVFENLAYRATATSGSLRYNWRMLLDGKVDSLLLSGITIDISANTVSASEGATKINFDQIVPQRWLALIPVDSIRIDRWQLDYRALDKLSLSFSGSLTIDPDLNLTLHTMLSDRDVSMVLRADKDNPGLDADIALLDKENTIAGLSAVLRRSEDDSWAWEIEGQTQYTALLSWLQQLEAQHDFRLGLVKANELELQGNTEFKANIQHPNTLNLATAVDPGVSLLQKIKIDASLHNTIQQLEIPTLGNLSDSVVVIDATYDEGQLSASLQPFTLTGNLHTQRLSLPDNTRRWLGWREMIAVTLETSEPLIITYGGQQLWSVQSNNSRLSLGHSDSRLRMQRVDLHAAVALNEPMETSLQLSTRLEARVQKQTLPTLEVAFSQAGSLEQSHLKVELSDTAESIRATLKGTSNLISGSSNFELDAQITDLAYFSTSTLPLLRHFKIVENDMEIRSGTIRLATNVRSKSFDVINWEQRSQLNVSNVSGTLDDYTFDGLFLAADWSGIKRLKTHKALTTSLKKIGAGFAVEDLNLRITLPKETSITRPQVRIELFTASLFGGEVFLPEAQFWDFNAASNHMTLRAKGWQLDKLVALQPNADIQAQGTLEGELPVTIIDGRLTIDNGYLRAMPPGGFIRYIPSEDGQALADSNAELALAIDLLSDFQYQVLSTEVQLDQTGNLLLGLSLAGSNPTQYDGQAINFNINLEQNLDPLLQSLRLSDNVSKQIERKMK